MGYNYEYPYDGTRQNADWLLSKVKDLDGKVKDLEEIVKEFDIDREEVERLIAEAVALTEAYTNSEIDSYDSSRMKPYVQQMLTDLEVLLREYINSEDELYYQASSNRSDHLFDDAITYIDNKVIAILDMENPVTGQIQNIPEVINYIVDVFHRGNALTAGEYDGYELTAQGYDSQLITAFQYDFDGRNAVVH